MWKKDPSGCVWIIIEITGKLKIDYRSREWCKMKYPGHKHGCPNYGEHKRCPPNAPLIEDFIDLDKPHWFVMIKFDMKKYMDETKEKHPNWSDAELRNSMWWQSHINKKLREKCKKFITKTTQVFDLRPEAMGIHVIRTAKRVKIPIKTRPTDTIYKIALIGFDPKRKTLAEAFV